MADGLAIVDHPRVLPQPANALLGRLRSFAVQPAVARALPLVGLGGLVLALLLAWSALTAAPQRELFPGLAEADKAAVAQALDTANVSYKVDAASGALRVSSDDYHRARMMLAAQGLPKATPTGLDPVGEMPLGASDAVEREHMQASREADLARTIEAIDAIGSARVHLAVEEPSLFVRDRKEPRASVMVTLRSGRALSEGQVAAITHLVSASVPGLAADGIAVIDQGGHLLSDPDGDPMGSTKQLDIQHRVETRYREALGTLLTPLVGAAGFSAEVHADLDFAQTDATRENFPEASRALRAEDQKITTDGSTAPAIGIPGTLSNTAPPSTGVTGTQPTTPDPNAAPKPPTTTTQDVSRRFELGREVSVTRGAQGTVKRLSLAVAVNETPGKKRSPQEIQQLEALVKGAVGFDAARGDVVTVSVRPFVAEPAVTTTWYESPWVPLGLKYGGGLLAALAGWFMIGRPLLKRFNAQTESIRRAEIGNLLEHQLGENGQTTAALAEPAPVTLEMIEAAPGYTARAALVRDFVRQDPARAALVLRDMIRSEPEPEKVSE